ncbi:hypothetical protein C7999DRAFT_33926 [Corynascus novoguineensis]|uniref:Rhodopsin domain-containing protein n=1 Tax=Corynascus novoguineensis TaxID=1126955 RepID=A0AAN7CQ10_9PEZI|nr:hypothetical protein C7999DRAFT_33926 [Corynascus novoguineensis]
MATVPTVNGVPVVMPPPDGYVVDFDNPQRNSVTEAYWLFGDSARGIMGTHSWEMPLTKFMLFLKALYQLPILYNPVQCGAKLSLLLVYRKLAPRRWYHVSVWLVGVVVVGSSVAVMFAAIFACTPVRSAWDLTITDGTCIDRPALYQATAILGAITDILVLAVPIPITITLQVSLKHKIIVLTAFGIGGV